MPNFRRLFADTPIDIESSSTAGETLADNDELIEEGKIRDVLRDYVKWGKRTFLEMSEEMNFEQSEKQQGDKFHGKRILKSSQFIHSPRSIPHRNRRFDWIGKIDRFRNS
jgi:hypothetical protein